jgi:thiol-disulfide isomerase/thioredoxin
MAGPVLLELLGRPGCCLCDDAEAALRALEREYRIEVVKVNVDTDPALAARYGDGVPVVLEGGRTWARHRIDPDVLRRKLDALGARRAR